MDKKCEAKICQKPSRDIYVFQARVVDGGKNYHFECYVVEMSKETDRN